jgi:uncharacterized hydantoinase/oxoprolinase family protein
MQDAYLVLGELPEDVSNTRTADGRPATIAAARARLARSICADPEMFEPQDATTLAASLADAQLDRIAAGIARVTGEMPEMPRTVILAGQGEFLGLRGVKRVSPDSVVVSLAQQLGPSVSMCAPAHALATIAREAGI